ncbi:hypothetical protein FRC10_003514 [Ceratobasidium sp. 414]|nr:hypothetical protein FRC10_003514 [Ceratobasidium sp. 414]
MTSAFPPLPPIASAQLRKRVFTHASVFRLASTQPYDQIENVDNDRLSFLGRATVEYALSTTALDIDLDTALASSAHAYDIVHLLHRGWRDPITPGQPPPTASPKPTQAQASQLMEAYIGALALESEQDAMQFANDLVRGSGGQISERERVSLGDGAIVPGKSAAVGAGATGELHDLAVRCGIALTWEDHAQGPKHAQEWTSDVTLRNPKTNQTWPCVARGVAKSKKLARADAAAKVLAEWDLIMQG